MKSFTAITSSCLIIIIKYYYYYSRLYYCYYHRLVFVSFFPSSFLVVVVTNIIVFSRLPSLVLFCFDVVVLFCDVVVAGMVCPSASYSYRIRIVSYRIISNCLFL